MELKHVIPNMEKTFGNLEYAGEGKVDDIVVFLPASAGEKNFEIEEKVKLINPKITATGYKIGSRGFTNYILSADDMVKA